MTINIENESIHSDEFEVSLSKTYEEIIEEVIIDALDYEECPYEAAVEVLLTDDSEIHEINLEQREIDRATDVLSFPMVDYDEAGSFDGFDDRYELFDPDSGELMLGDIVISVEHVLSQAREYGHSTDRELAFLIAHSMLHLMGYDHMEDEERAEMERKQEEILLIHGYTR
ncbi:MAG: rRNA maturation RNase YbeY [Eubacteriales bacterium]|nr:rRNA maturation RNase YbeY [Eubacteriales bacterium]